MTQRFYTGFTTECEDGHFLVVGQNIDADYTAVFLLPEAHHDDVQWGRILSVDFTGPKKAIEGDWFPYGSLKSIDEALPKRDQAAAYQQSVNDFMEQKGWVETESADLGDTLATMQAYFNVFPE